MNPLTIYIAGPLSAPTKHGMMVNVRKALRVALEIAKKGHIFYSPHLSVYFDEYAQEQQVSLPWEYWMQFDDIWVQKCDAFYYMGSSRGADIELTRAKELGKQVFYSLEEVPEVKEA